MKISAMSRPIQSLSNWESYLKARALTYLTVSDAVHYLEQSQTFYLDDDWKTKVKNNTNFWLIFSAGIEMLVKTALIKHDVIQLRRRAAKHNPSIDVCVNKALEAALTSRVRSSNAHITSEFQRTNIQALWEIDTLALGAVADKKGVDRLIAKAVLSQSDGELLKQRLHCFAFIRRNVEAHIFLGQSAVEIGSDMTTVYLPMLNQLTHIL